MSLWAVVILNWNGAGDTIDCLSSLYPEIGGNDYVFVVDNGSTDDSVERIRRHLPLPEAVVAHAADLPSSYTPSKRFYVVKNGVNAGFGGGNNVILQRLRRLDPRFTAAWLLNNDAVVLPGALSALRKKLESGAGTGAAGSLILNYPRRETIQCSGVRYFPMLGVSKLINKNLPLERFDRDADVRFDYLNGASLALKLDALEKCGFFDERFFLYSEELDLQLRLAENGYTLALATDSRVCHRLGSATSAGRHRFFYHYNLSAMLLTKKHYGAPTLVSAFVSLCCITFFRAFPSVKSFAWGMSGLWKGLWRRS